MQMAPKSKLSDAGAGPSPSHINIHQPIESVIKTFNTVKTEEEAAGKWETGRLENELWQKVVREHTESALR